MTIRQWVPKPIKKILRKAYNEYLLGRAIRAIAAHPYSVPSLAVLSDLIEGWGNDGYSATAEYLQAISAAALKAEGAVLECGSGISSILMNLLCAPRNVPVWSLEHYPEWREHVRTSMKKHGIDSSHVVMAPLRESGDYAWYDAPLTEMPRNFSVVICDGPPGDTRGGRYGVLPRCADYFSRGASIFLDDANRPKEQEVLERWKKEYQVSVDLSLSAKSGYALVRMP